MKALVLRQPWLDMILASVKTIETRTWRTNYRGPLLLCSSKTLDKSVEFEGPGIRGHALCVVELVDSRPMTKDDEGPACCACELGRYAWIFKSCYRIRPFPVRGQLGLFEVKTDWKTLPYPSRSRNRRRPTWRVK